MRSDDLQDQPLVPTWICRCLYQFYRIIPGKSAAGHNRRHRLTEQIFLFSITGILLCDYYIVQKGKVDLKSLYTAERDGNYWYTYGVNWRAMVAYVVGAAINFVGCK
jgi:hypothetical protein